MSVPQGGELKLGSTRHWEYGGREGEPEAPEETVRCLVLLAFQKNEACTAGASACSNCPVCLPESLQNGDFLTPWEILWEEKGGSIWK